MTKRVAFVSDQSLDWTWLLRVPVKAGEPVPMELFFLWHCNTLLPLKAALQAVEAGDVFAA